MRTAREWLEKGQALTISSSGSPLVMLLMATASMPTQKTPNNSTKKISVQLLLSYLTKNKRDYSSRYHDRWQATVLWRSYRLFLCICFAAWGARTAFTAFVLCILILCILIPCILIFIGHFQLSLKMQNMFECAFFKLPLLSVEKNIQYLLLLQMKHCPCNARDNTIYTQT